MNRTKFTTFKNGSKLAYRKYKNDGNATAIFVGFFSGHRYTKNGLAHLFEHVMCNGLSNKSFEEKRLEFGAFSPTTYNDVMGIEIYSSNRNIEESLAFASEILFSSQIKQSEIKKQVEIIKQERERRSNQMSKDLRFLEDVQLEKEYKDLNDFLFCVYGSNENLDNFSVKDLNDYRKKHFTANKFIMLTSSTLPSAKIKSFYKKYFLPHLNDKKVEEILPPKKNLIVEKSGIWAIEDKDAKVYTIDILIKDNHIFDQDYFIYNYDRDFLCYFVTQGSASLQHKLRNEGYTYSVSCVIFNYSNAFKNYTTRITLSTDKLENVKPILSSIGEWINNVKKTGISKEIYENYRKLWLMSKDYPKVRKNNYATLNKMLNEYLTFREEDPYKEFSSDKKIRKYFDKSTIETINKSINETFDPGNDIYIFVKGNLTQSDLSDVKDFKDLLSF